MNSLSFFFFTIVTEDVILIISANNTPVTCIYPTEK